MADFIRPQARAALHRWREVLAALAIGALGLRWGLASGSLLAWLGWAMVAGAAALGYAGLQRLRFAPDGGGPGIVTVDERRVVYWGPETGGVADMDMLARLDLAPADLAPADIAPVDTPPADAAPTWLLTLEDGTRLEIPANATGADRLFDLFAALPGLSPETLVRALHDPPQERTTLWKAGARRLS